MADFQGPAEREKACRPLRSLRASFFFLLMKAGFHRTEKIKPVAFSGQAFSLVGVRRLYFIAI
jgi:hypothetical protein